MFKCFKNSLAALWPTFKMIPPIDACYPSIKYSITAINYRCNPKLEKSHAVEVSISTNSKEYFIMLLKMISAETSVLT